MQSRLVALQRQLRGSERRAAVLQQDKERTATVLQRKRQQLQDCKQTVQELQVHLFTPTCTMIHILCHSFHLTCTKLTTKLVLHSREYA